MANLHREFLDAGSDVLQALTFYATDDGLNNAVNKHAGKNYTVNYKTYFTGNFVKYDEFMYSYSILLCFTFYFVCNNNF